MKTLPNIIESDETIEISDYRAYADPDRVVIKTLTTIKTCKICKGISFHVLTKDFKTCDKCGFIQ